MLTSNRNYLVRLLLISSIFLTSCGKQFIYFQKQENSKNNPDTIRIAQLPDPMEHIISYGDLIDLNFYIRDAQMANIFSGTTEENSASATPGYPVDEQGFIFLPIIGNVMVANKTIREAEIMLKDTFSNYFNDFNFSLRLTGIRITMLGAVNGPGVKILPGDKATIIDALGVSGDVQLYGKPMNIKVIRNTPEGKKTILVNLNDIDVFLSEAYYLQSNDLIYVERQSRVFVRENLQYITIVTSLANLFTIIVLQFRR